MTFKKKAGFILIVLCCALWFSGFLFIKKEARNRLDRFVELQAMGGRQWKCLNRDIQGWGMQLALICDSLTVSDPFQEIETGPVQITYRIFDPFPLSISIHGPFQWHDGQRNISFDASPLELKFSADVKERTLHDAHLSWKDIHNVITNVALPEKIEMLQLSLVSANSDERMINISVQGVSWILMDGLFKRDGLWNILGTASVSRFSALGCLGQKVNLVDWQAKQGQIIIETFKALSGDDEILDLVGNLTLDSDYYPEGKVEISAKGIDGLQWPPDAGNNNSAVGSNDLQMNENKGNTIRKMQFSMKGGRLFLGGFPLPGKRLPVLVPSDED